MAYDDSEALQPNSTYSLGGYTFELKVQNVHEPGEPDVVSVFAICRGPDGNRQTQAMDFPEGTEVEEWYVEANETEASVYVRTADGTINAMRVSCDVKMWMNPRYVYRSDTITGDDGGSQYSIYREDQGVMWLTRYDGHTYAATESGPIESFGGVRYINGSWEWSYVQSIRPPLGYYTQTAAILEKKVNLVPESDIDPSGKPISMSLQGGEYLIGRFAIDLSEADGGPDGDWDEPGDTGDPSYTLNVSVTGASSGSNSGIPLEAQEQTTYGSGGYGGNGGGGGAGASTVIIYEFATDKAATVNQEATAQSPGAGGPGGKGGKGGDGCILIFY